MKWFLVTPIILLSFASCSKDVAMPDYRDEYVGNYTCTRYYQMNYINMTPIYDTSIVQLEIKKDENSTDKIIVDSDTVIVQLNGTVDETNNPPSYIYRITFRNDSIYFYRKNYYTGGSVSTDIIGIKTN